MKKLLIGFVVLIALTVGGIAAFLTTIDVNRYRDRIAEELSSRTGRKISLYGPITLGLSWSGVTLTVFDASIGNPPWASRPVMADVGRFDLGLSLRPLFDHKIVITRLGITGADIDLEAESGNRDNWGFTPPTHAKEAERQPGSPVSIHIGKFSVVDSKVTFYDRDGNAHAFVIASMTVDSDNGAHMRLNANYNGVPVSFDLKTGADDLLPPRGSWPFSTAISYGDYKLSAVGKADIDAKSAVLSRYELARGGSSIGGELAVDWAREVPVLRGTLTGGSVVLSDFAGSANKKSRTVFGQAGRKRMFDDEPLALDGLKAVNGAFDVSIGEIVLPNNSLGNITAKVDLKDGFLSINHFRALLGEGVVEGKIDLSDAESPAQFGIVLSASKVDLTDVLHLASAPGFVSGRADIDVKLAGAGDSVHAMAANAIGIINLVATGGNVSGSMLSDVSSLLLTMFAPGGSNDMQCIAARFIVKDGIAHDNGILIDTTSTTIAGNGDLNFPQETIDITLHAKTKHVNVGVLLPAAYIGGTFLKPRFSVNPADVLENVTGLIASDDTGYDVPDILTHEGDNACLYTLEHPAPQKAVAPGIPTDTLAGKAANTLNGVENAIRGLLGQ